MGRLRWITLWKDVGQDGRDSSLIMSHLSSHVGASLGTLLSLLICSLHFINFIFYFWMFEADFKSSFGISRRTV